MDVTFRQNVPVASRRLLATMLGLFLGGGMLNASEALLVPRILLTPNLGYAEALTIQLAYYSSYLGFAYPAAGVTARIGAMRAAAVGAGAVSLGTAALGIGLASPSFPFMLAALLVMSLGVTILQIACNGAMATLGERGPATARFTALQGFNSLGTVLAPLLVAGCLLGGSGAIAALPFLGFSFAFGMLARACHQARNILPRSGWARPRPALLRQLMRRREIKRGVIAIFAYVGAEVTIGTLAPNYLMQPDRGAVAPVLAGTLVAFYWLGAMIGRFAGATLLRGLAATTLLSWAALLAVALTFLAALPIGPAGAVALLSLGLANAIMFPTIFTLAMPTDTSEVPATAMLLCMAVVGGAIVPEAAGIVADRCGLSVALALPAACYIAILRFARRAAI